VNTAEKPRLIRINKVIDRTGRSKGWIYGAYPEGRFPKPVRLGPGPRDGVGWVEQEVDDWIEERIAERDRGAA
jgi:prophage regulatory protein